jgi:crotonobetainyl-CoA:carnitine CoA-transferase CaiB-like acyl-CoA transferase
LHAISKPASAQHRAALEARLNATLSAKRTAEWEAELSPLGVPISAICSIPEVKARFPDAFVTVEHPTAGTHSFANGPFVLSGGEVDFSAPAPSLGQHTAAILGEFGFSDADVEDLRQRGIV